MARSTGQGYAAVEHSLLYGGDRATAGLDPPAEIGDASTYAELKAALMGGPRAWPELDFARQRLLVARLRVPASCGLLVRRYAVIEAGGRVELAVQVEDSQGDCSQRCDDEAQAWVIVVVDSGAPGTTCVAYQPRCDS